MLIKHIYYILIYLIFIRAIDFCVRIYYLYINYIKITKNYHLTGLTTKGCNYENRHKRHC